MLWGLLGLLLVFGTVGAATFVYGVVGTGAGRLVDLAVAGVGGAIAVLSFLFMAGILYRVDRYRGATHRRVEFFE